MIIIKNKQKPSIVKITPPCMFESIYRILNLFKEKNYLNLKEFKFNINSFCNKCAATYSM